MATDGITIRETAVEAIRPLRHAVLRAGLPAEAAIFEGDDEPSTRHVGALTPAGEVVGCATIVQRSWNGEPAWQLRGMAVDPGLRGRGIGKRLLMEIERIVQSCAGTRLLWCNARTPAVGFYQALGWRTVGEQFHIETAGPHYQMVKRL